MMKNTLIVIAEEAVNAYRTCMMEHFYADMNYLQPIEFAKDLEQFGRDLQILCGAPSVALPAFRSQFGCGSTMMMLSDEQCTQLENWHTNNEEFRIAIFKQDGSAVGIVEQKNICW